MMIMMHVFCFPFFISACKDNVPAGETGLTPKQTNTSAGVYTNSGFFTFF
jgi:hypothetical protein